MNWYLAVLKKYAVFNGRATRSEYWFFVLFNIIASVVLSIGDKIVGTYSAATGLGLLSGVYAIAVLLPGIGVSIRRLHDIGRSGWWLLIAFVPFIGAIVLLIFAAQDSAPGDNEYGPYPKPATA